MRRLPVHRHLPSSMLRGAPPGKLRTIRMPHKIVGRSEAGPARPAQKPVCEMLKNRNPATRLSTR
jgi:hypothetical protein